MGNVRNASLDGLRAVAVLLVFLYHHGLLNSGWIGVDAFFVLSGFLITGLLRKDRESSHYWSNFWTKRVLRIMPPLVLVLLLAAALSLPLSVGLAGAYLLSLGDLIAYLRPHNEALRPLWSLAVEEHFYLFWPLGIRYCNRRTVCMILMAVIAAEPLLRGLVTIVMHQWVLTYFLTPFRLDALAIGSLLALGMEDVRMKEVVRRWSTTGGLCFAGIWLVLRLVLGRAFTRDNPTITYNSLCYSLTAAVCACGVSYLITHPESRACKLLRAKPLPWLGLVSYGLYLYQVPVHEAVLRLEPQLSPYAWMIDAPITLILAALSYYGVERPMMSLGRRRARARAADNTGVTSQIFLTPGVATPKPVSMSE